MDLGQELALQDEFAFFVFLARFKSTVVLPSNCVLTLLATYVAHQVLTSGHVALALFKFVNVDDVLEEKCLPVLATEVLRPSSVQRVGYWEG